MGKIQSWPDTHMTLRQNLGSDTDITNRKCRLWSKGVGVWGWRGKLHGEVSTLKFDATKKKLFLPYNGKKSR